MRRRILLLVVAVALAGAACSAPVDSRPHTLRAAGIPEGPEADMTKLPLEATVPNEGASVRVERRRMKRLLDPLERRRRQPVARGAQKSPSRRCQLV